MLTADEGFPLKMKLSEVGIVEIQRPSARIRAKIKL